jgi:hypothetical protein
MQPNWVSVSHKKSHCRNLRFVPWPHRIEPAQFVATKKNSLSDDVKPGGYGLFTFTIPKGPSVEEVKALLAEAERSVGPIGGVLFPELAAEATVDCRKVCRAGLRYPIFITFQADVTHETPAPYLLQIEGIYGQISTEVIYPRLARR